MILHRFPMKHLEFPLKTRDFQSFPMKHVGNFLWKSRDFHHFSHRRCTETRPWTRASSSRCAASPWPSCPASCGAWKRKAMGARSPLMENLERSFFGEVGDIYIYIYICIYIYVYICIHIYLAGGDWNITFIFPYIGTNHPNWLIFFRGIETTHQIYMYVYIYIYMYTYFWYYILMILYTLI